MMRRCASLSHQLIPIRPADKTIEQTISVDVAAFYSTKEKPDTAIAMDSGIHVREP